MCTITLFVGEFGTHAGELGPPLRENPGAAPVIQWNWAITTSYWVFSFLFLISATLSPSVSSVSQSVCQVLPSSGDDPSQQSRKLKNPASLIQDFISLIHFNNKPTNNLYVHRDELFNDNIAFFKNCRFDAKSGPIRVHFEGEEGIDAGGLIRENFCIFFQEVQSPEKNLVISTPTGKLLPSNNQFHTFSGMYQVLGNAIGTALLNEVSVEIPLHKAVIAVILKKTQEEIYAQLHKNDIIDLSLQDFITEVMRIIHVGKKFWTKCWLYMYQISCGFNNVW